MKATLIRKTRDQYRDGIIEVVIWQVPEPVPPSEHPFKYRLVYIANGERVIGYDNERGKGDHKHIGGQEQAYAFTTPAQLLADFWRDIQEATQ